MTRLNSVLGVVLATVTGLLCTAPAAGADPPKVKLPKRQIVSGMVQDAGGRRVEDAIVFIFDAETGLPYSSVSDTPFSEPQEGNDGPPIARDVTGGDGRFSIRGVFPGTYRLVVQSWEGVDVGKTPLLDFKTKRLTVRGVSEPFPVTEDKEPEVGIITPRGSASLDVLAKDGSIVLVSAEPPSGDIILGPLALKGAFARKLVAFTLVHDGRVIIDGLSEGELHLFAIANSRHLVLGQTTVTAKAGELVEAAIEMRPYGLPSDPPPVPERLQPLVDLMDRDMKAVRAAAAALGDHAESIKSEADYAPFLDWDVELPGGQRVPLRDVMAAEAYRDRQREAKDQAKPAKPAEPAKPADAAQP